MKIIRWLFLSISLDDLKPNQILCLDDGRIELIDSVQDDVILTKVLVGALSNRKGLNVGVAVFCFVSHTR